MKLLFQKLDKQTGRYFYVDHKAKTTHWTLPDEVKDQMIKKIPLKDDSGKRTIFSIPFARYGSRIAK